MTCLIEREVDEVGEVVHRQASWNGYSYRLALARRSAKPWWSCLTRSDLGRHRKVCYASLASGSFSRLQKSEVSVRGAYNLLHKHSPLTPTCADDSVRAI